PEYRKRLIAALQMFAEDNENDRWIVADALSSASTSLVGDDPSAAANVGTAALKFGGGQEIGTLISALRDKNPAQADALFRNALAVIQEGSSNSARLLFSLLV